MQNEMTHPSTLGAAMAGSKEDKKRLDDVVAAAIARAKSVVRSTGRTRKPKCRCIVRKYKDIKDRCMVECGSTSQAHHIVPDYLLRYGTRPQPNDTRIPPPEGSAKPPDLKNGPAICLDGGASTRGSEHNTAHLGDRDIAANVSTGNQKGPPICIEKGPHLLVIGQQR